MRNSGYKKYHIQSSKREPSRDRQEESFDSFLNHSYTPRVSYVNSIHTSSQSETPGYKIMKRASNDMKYGKLVNKLYRLGGETDSGIR